MNLRIDRAGRLVLPKSIRSQLGITPETSLELIPRADGVLLRRVADRPSMQQVDGLWVHLGVSANTGNANAGTASPDWAAVIEDVRNERADNAWKA